MGADGDAFFQEAAGFGEGLAEGARGFISLGYFESWFLILLLFYILLSMNLVIFHLKLTIVSIPISSS